MLRSIAEDVRRQFDYGNMITRLIIINTAIFLLINLVRLGFNVTAGFNYDPRFHDVVRFFSLSADLIFDVTHPWVIITHMFLHLGFLHFLFNMLFLYWFGRIVGDFIGNHRIFPLYLMAGLFGAILYLLSAPVIHAEGSYAYGASASVMGFVLASGVLAPDYRMHLLLIGEVKLKYIVLVLILLDIIGIGGLDNTGGRIAHLGGAAFGWIYIAMLQRGNDLSAPVNRMMDAIRRLFSPRTTPPPMRRSSPVTVQHRTTQRAARKAKTPERSPMDQERIDAILDKIKQSGYDSLTAEEKEFLFHASKQ